MTAGSDAASGLINSQIGGFQTPVDPTPTPQNADTPAQVSRGDDYLANGGSFSYSIAGDGLQLISDNLRVNGGDVIHGPYLISQSPAALNTGDKISFSWRGEVTDNAYDVYAYLLDADTGSATELLDSYGNSTTGWSNVTHTVTTDASYYFVFVAGSFDYDFTGSITTASPSGNSPVSGAITASAAGTAASGITAATTSGTATGASTFSNVRNPAQAAMAQVQNSPYRRTDQEHIALVASIILEMDIRLVTPSPFQVPALVAPMDLTT